MKKLLIACAVAATFVATAASAQGYVGLGVGSSKISGADGNAGGGVTLSGGNANKTSIKVYGGFQFTPTWGLEGQYTDLGSRNLTATLGGAVVGTGSVKANQFSIAGTGTLPLASNFSLLGKLGLSANRASVSGLGGSSSANKTDMLIGVGVSYSITPKMAVRLEYEDFGKFSKDGGVNGGAIRANNVSIGLQYAF